MFTLRFLCALTLAILFSAAAVAQVGKPFPEIEGSVLSNDRQISLPGNAKGKVTIIGVAYSKKSDENLQAWYEPMYYRFVNPPTNEGSDVLGGVDYPANVNLYFVGMVRGIAKAASGKIEKKMREDIDSRFHGNIMVYDGGSVKDYIDQLNMDSKSDPYFFVIDADGEIVYATSGRYSKRKMQEIVSKVDEELW